MQRGILVTGVALATLVGCRRAHAQVPPNDPTPLLASLRPAAQAELPNVQGLGRLADLPRYDLGITLHDAGARFSLRETAWITNTERAPLREVVFRVYANAVRSQGATPTPGVPTVRFLRGRCLEGACSVAAESPSVIAVRPSTPIAPGARVRVELELEAAVPEIAAGRTSILSQGMESLSSLGAAEANSDYGLLARGDGILSLGNFYPVLARRVQGRWERSDSGGVGDLGSDDLSNVSAVIDAPSDMVLATTGVSVHTVGAVSPAAGRQRVEVVAGAVRDFALVGGTRLTVATRQVGDVEVRSMFLPEHRAAGERVLDAAAGALQVYERRFGPYPYRDLDVCEAALVGGAGGVEFPGLVTVASMFYRPATEGSGLLAMLGGGDVLGQMLPSMLEFVTAHEVAHQWWHALVGSDSRSHPFLDESLAQYASILYLEDRYGAERARRDGDLNVRMNYQFMRTLGTADGAVDRPTGSFGSSMAYAGIVYGKGPYYYRALREAAGDAVFFRALRRYADTWRFRSAPNDGFVQAMVAEHGAGAARYRALARHWLQEAHGDADLGQLDLASALGPMLGGAGGVNNQELQQALQMLGPLLQGLGQGQGGAPAAGGSGGAQPTPDGLEQMLQQALQGLQ